MRVSHLLILLLVSGCGGGGGYAASGDPHFSGLSCAPFARAETGVDLHGAAADWWTSADGRYERSHDPVVGSILVLDRESRLPSGHVAVVSRLAGPRRIEVVQANWVPGELARDQPVIDVSEDGDWSMVRIWYPPVRAMGNHAYPALGFIVPQRPMSREALDLRADRAAEVAAGS